MNVTRRAVLGSFAALGLLPTAACADEHAGGGADSTGLAGVLLADPVAKPTIAFTDTDGQPYDLVAETEGRLTLLTFGYTSCPDVCPITLSVIEAALTQLGDAAAGTIVVFVGVDNARDTRERLRNYVDDRGAGFVGLNPQVSSAELDAQLLELLLPGVIIGEPGEDGSYVVGHPSQVLVFGGDDTAHVMYPYGVSTADWVRDLPRLEDFDWGA